MKVSVKTQMMLLMILVCFSIQKPISTIRNIRLTTAKPEKITKARKLIGLPSFLGGSKPEDEDDPNAKTTIMLLNVMERQQQIRKVKDLVDQLRGNLTDLKSLVNSEVSQLSQLANASLNSDRFVIDGK